MDHYSMYRQCEDRDCAIYEAQMAYHNWLEEKERENNCMMSAFQFQVATRDAGKVVGYVEARDYAEAVLYICTSYDVVSILWMNDIGSVN